MVTFLCGPGKPRAKGAFQTESVIIRELNHAVIRPRLSANKSISIHLLLGFNSQIVNGVRLSTPCRSRNREPSPVRNCISLMMTLRQRIGLWLCRRLPILLPILHQSFSIDSPCPRIATFMRLSPRSGIMPNDYGQNPGTWC